ncbi:hypothetical protein LMG23994_05972 [Cupriavidus pinatubonensis]|uniref:Uncharacterized protein n=1 Tax=Cupriavidus pinatubonensis TaxID=248026 RepID=A0ABN7ZPD8_9BURK|nr:hypothetical protein LMG23994_05972 [Cupriavidus pinatubonensis]
MTSRTIGEPPRVLQVIHLLQQRDFVGGNRCGIAHRDDIRRRMQMPGGVAVASQAPLHVERRHAAHQRHLVHAPVAFLAGKSLGDVDAVIEADKVRQVVHARPDQRAIVPQAVAKRREHWGVTKQHAVTGQAYAGARHARERRRFHGRMTVPAIDAVIGNVMLVAEWYGLLDRFLHLDRGCHGPPGHPEGPGDKHDRTNAQQLEDKQFRARECLRHGVLCWGKTLVCCNPDAKLACNERSADRTTDVMLALKVAYVGFTSGSRFSRVSNSGGRGVAGESHGVGDGPDAPVANFRKPAGRPLSRSVGLRSLRCAAARRWQCAASPPSSALSCPSCPG